MPEKNRTGRTVSKTLNVEKTLQIAGVAVTATAADLNSVSGFSATGAALKKVAKVALAGVDTAGGLFAWLNPEVGAIVVNRVTLDVTTVPVAVCTVSVGETAVSAVTLSANLITGLDVHTAVITADNISAPGATGKALQRVPAGAWITGSTVSGASSGIVGNAYIEYVVV